MSEITVTLKAQAGLALAWVKAIRLLAPILMPVLGADRLSRAASTGAMRLMLIKIGRDRWRFLRP